MCVYTMILECCSSNSVGHYSGYYYAVSMAVQVITPILSGVVMDVNPAMLFAYITGMGVLMGLSVAGAKHGDAILIDEGRPPRGGGRGRVGRVPAPLLPAVSAPDSVHKDEPDLRIRPIRGSFSSKCTLNP